MFQAFFKSLKLITQTYGNIYMDFAEPISAKEFLLSKIDRSVHSLGPISNQHIVQIEKDCIPLLAHEIVHRQQRHSVVTTISLVSILLTNSLSTRQSLNVDQVQNDTWWLKSVVEALGANTAEVEVKDALKVHQNLICIHEKTSVVQLVKETAFVDAKHSKGYNFPRETMIEIVPMVMLQNYINPAIHLFVSPAIIVSVLKKHRSLCISKFVQGMSLWSPPCFAFYVVKY